MKKLMLIALLSLTACGKTYTRVTEEVAIPATTVPLTDVQEIVADENEYRNGLGQSTLSPGLSCALYTIVSGDRIQSSIPGHNTLSGISHVASFTHDGSFNQISSSVNDGMNVLPLPLRVTYKNMYLLRCQGQIVITETGYYNFELTSDDASILYVGGAKVIDNDNNHSPTLVVGQKYLRRGVHTFRIDYAQAGGGSQALILKSSGVAIPTDRFYK